MKTAYNITRISRRYAPGRCTITTERRIASAVPFDYVSRIFDNPESYDGEREEALSDLHEMGFCSYAGYTIDEYRV